LPPFLSEAVCAKTLSNLGEISKTDLNKRGEELQARRLELEKAMKK
jgi:hypothetical protein